MPIRHVVFAPSFLGAAELAPDAVLRAFGRRVVRLAGLAGGANGGGITPENERFMANPAPMVLQTLCASLFCVLWALKFESAPRQNFPRLQRIAGRVAAPCCIAQHQAWMGRTCALGQGAGTQVLILLPVTLVAGEPTFIFRYVLMASAGGLNIVFAEWVIRRRLPST